MLLHLELILVGIAQQANLVTVQLTPQIIYVLLNEVNYCFLFIQIPLRYADVELIRSWITDVNLRILPKNT